MPKSVLAAILISAAIRLTILWQAPSVTYDAYQELTQIRHIAETGLPLINDPNTWDGATHNILPLFHYLAAFVSILLPIPDAALLIANLAALAIPLAVWALAKEVTTHKHAPELLALASAFTPLLYRETVITANPLALAIPLLLGAHYYFLRLGKTPRDQKLFIILTVALALTHPISLLLAAAMITTLTLNKIQSIQISRSLTEATLFATFFSVWINLLVHAETLRTHALQAIIQPITPTTLAQATTSAGLLVVLAGTFAASNYLQEEKNAAAHAIIALTGVTLLLTLARILPANMGILLFSITLLVLAAGAIEQYQISKHKSRAPIMYTLGAILLSIIFITTSAAPAITLGYEPLTNTPTQAEMQLIQELEQIPRHKTHWTSQQGDLLRYHGFPTASTNNPLISPDATSIQADLNALKTVNNPVRYITLLSHHDIELVILDEQHTRPITQQCFERIPTTNYEVYRVTCAIN